MSQAVVMNMPAPHGDAKLKCGQCKWFVQGFEGKTCQVTRKVLGDTRACIEFQIFKSSPFAHIEKDKFLIEMRKTMKVWTEDSIKKYSDEIKTYKVVQGDSILKDPMAYVEEGKIAELGEKFNITQVYLERLIDLKFTVQDKYVELQSFAKEVQSYLFTEYRDQVQALKNESERGAFFRAAAPELFRALDKMESLKDKCDTAYQNLKDAHFNLARKQDAVLALWEARVQSLAGRNRTSG